VTTPTLPSARVPTPAETSAPRSAPRPRVLLLPGLGGSSALVSPVAARLFPGMRLVPFEHGHDVATGGVEGLAERALALLDADEDADAPAYVCGESFGGTVALTLARRYPERVRGLILLSAFGWYPGAASRGSRVGFAAWRRLGDPAVYRLMRASRPLGIPGQLGLACSREILWAYLRHPDGHPTAYRVKCELSVQFDARPWLPNIAHPAFVLVGTWDPVVPISAGHELACLIPNARLHQVPGGHLVHITRAAEAGRLIARWTAQTNASERRPVPSPSGRGLG
jgi:pimeloyl-ACP methyl ester carboxylesterase